MNLPKRRAFSPRPEGLERRDLLTVGAWPLHAVDPSSSVLIKFNDSSTPLDRQNAINSVEGYINVSHTDGPALLSLGQGIDLNSALTQLRSNPAVSYVEANRKISVDSTPNDPSFSQQWALNQSNGVDLKAPNAWDVTTGTTSTIVAVIDTGLDTSHPEFAGRLWVNPTANNDGYTGDVNGYNFADYNSDLSDSVGHGTHVTGIIAATGNNSVGVAGLNWNAKIMVCKYYGASGGYLSSAIEAIYFAADHGAKVINASWGTPVNDPALSSAISYANSKGSVFVSAAGNNSANVDTNPFYPASYHGPNTLTVASIDSSGSLSSFSNYGPNTVDIAAPGGSILSTLPGSSYGYLSGTSMAAPMVSGVASLVAGLHPTWTPAQIVQQILSTVTPLTTLTGKVVKGGIVNAAKAVGYTTSSSPVISISDGINNVLGGTEAFGTTVQGTPVTKTLTITDTGSAPLTLGAVTLPSGFSIVTGFGTTTLAPGGSTTLVVQMNATAAGSYSGVLSFATNDPTHTTALVTLTGTVTVPTIAISDGINNVLGGTEAFGTTVQGTPVTKTLTITDTGSAPLTLGAVTLPSGFSIVTGFGTTTLAPGASTTLVVQMNATAAGSYSGVLSFATNDPTRATAQVTLTGTVSVPTIAISDGINNVLGGTEAFGTTVQGTPVTKTLTITDTGSAPLTLGAVTLPSGFSIVTGFGTTTLAPGGSTTLVVQMNATAAGSYSGVLSFATNDPTHTTALVTLTGTVTVPTIAISDGINNVLGGTEAFGTTVQGTPVTKTLTITDTGSAPLTLGAVTLPSGFSIVTGFGTTTLAPGASTTLVVQMNATAAGSYSGVLSFATNDPTHTTALVTLTGTVTVPTIAISDGINNVLGGTEAFGTTVQGTPVTKTLTITDTGSAPLTLGAVTLPSGFSIVTGFGTTTLAPGASTTLVVQMNATAAGSYSGVLSFATNDPTHTTALVTLTGTVTVPTIAISDGINNVLGGTEAFGTTVQGTPVTKTLTITDTGSAPLTLGAVTLPSGFSIVTGFGTTTLAPGASTTLVVQMNATAAGSYSGVLSFATNDPTHTTALVTLTGTVTVPTIAISDGINNVLGGTEAFGTTVQGTPVTKTLTITDTGSAPLTLGAVTLPSGFSIVTGFGTTTLAPGASTTLVVQMNATAAGSYSGVLSFATNDPTRATAQVTLTGTVSVPTIAISDGINNVLGGTEAFGTTVQGTPVTKTLTITDTGSAPLTLGAVTLPSGFSIVTGFGTTTLAPGGSTTLVVQMNATAAGSYSGVLSFATNDPTHTTALVTLTGTVTVPTIAISDGINNVLGGTEAFGTTVQGTPVTKTLTITDTGSAPLTLGAVTLPSGFSIVTGFGTTTLAPGGSTTLVVQMNATAAGSYSGVLSFATNDPTHTTALVTLTGTVTVPTIAISDGINNVLGGTEAFGTTVQGTPVTKTLTITDTGSAPLTLGAVTLPSGFSIVTGFGTTTLAPGASTTVVVQMNATAAGSYSGVLSFATNDPTHTTALVTLTGTVTVPTIAISDGINNVLGGTEAFGTTVQGTPVTKTLTITDTGSAPLTLGAVTLPSGFSIVTGFGTTTLAPGASTTLVVQMNATAAGSYSGVLSFATNDPTHTTALVTLTGTVTVPTIAISDGINNVLGGTEAFGTTVQGTPVTKTLTITDTGSAPLTLGAVTLPSGFSIVTGFGTTTLAPGGSTTLVVQMNATAAGSYSGVLSFATNDPTHTTALVTLTGTVTVPTIAISDGINNVLGGTEAFGTTVQGTPVTKTLTITDTGSAPLTLGAVTLPSGFSIVTGFGTTTLAPGASTTLVVQMNATAAGSYSGVLSFATNDPTHTTALVTLTGTVTVPTIQVLDRTSDVLAGTSIVSFGTSSQGSPVTKTLTIIDTGTAALNLGSITLPTGFTLVSSFGSSTLRAGASTTLVVQMSATTAGSYSGVLSFATNDPTHNIVQITLNGTVTVPTIKILDGTTDVLGGTSTVSFGTTAQTFAVTKTLTITDTGTAPLALGTVSLPTGFTLVSNFASTTLAPGESTTLVVQMDAANVGSYSGVLSFGTNDPTQSTVQITLSGTVTAKVAYLDDYSSAFKSVGAWRTGSLAGYYGTSSYYRFATAVATTNPSPPAVTWSTTLTPGTYKVSADWKGSPSFVPDAPYTVKDGGNTIGTVVVNQTVSAFGFTDAGVVWQDLGTFTITSTTLSVVLTAASSTSSRFAVADAIRVERMS